MLKQNVFRDRSLVKATIAACSLKSSDVVYEIEPEDDLVTDELAGVARRVIILVKQPLRAQALVSRLQENANIEICAVDFVQYTIEEQSYKVFANLTSFIPSEVVKKLLYAKTPPLESFLIMQEDVANKYAGISKETELSLLTKPWFEVTVLQKFRRGDFEPLPLVDIVLLNFKMRKRPLVSLTDANLYRSFIKFSLEAGKKGLDVGYTTLFTEEQWKRITKDLDVKLSVKPADLTFDHWLRLFGYFVKFIPDSKRMPLLKKKVK